MSQAVSPDQARIEAREYVSAIRGLYIHAIVFAAVLAALFLVNLTTGPEWWVHWVLIGWGIGLAAHLFAVTLRFAVFGPEWEMRQIERRMARLAARL